VRDRGQVSTFNIQILKQIWKIGTPFCAKGFRGYSFGGQASYFLSLFVTAKQKS